MDKGISLIVIPQPACPAAIVSATHTPSNFLHSAILKNVSQRPLLGFRVGWVIRFRSGKPDLRLGAPFNLATAVEPGGVCPVPPQEVNSDDLEKGAVLTGFFLAEVYLLGDKPWKADLPRIKAES